MTKFEEEFNYLIELYGKVLIGQVDAEAFEKNRIAFFEKYETDQQQALPKTVEDFQGELEDLIDDILDDYISDLPFDGKKYKFIEKYAPQALPVVPECVADEIKRLKQEYGSLRDLYSGNVVWLNNGTRYLEGTELDLAEWVIDHESTFENAWLDGYTVEKPQLFKLIFPNSTAVLQKDGELNSFADTVYKRYLMENAMTEQEIKSIDERYWQFAVPVEDGE